ncbi:hypothetical protein [Segetibacter sp.]|jgi:isoquinoline 1-oxidoreductase beta subunit|uniref:hypothetical protein n=1 Tax=Segetibacter sp. TaxID=2231182 RepID=UPI00260AAE01|nr:hypothetical protein [Segetibacter sp.]
MMICHHRPTYTATYRETLDEKDNLMAYYVKAGGIPEGPFGYSQNRFPAGAVNNHLTKEWKVDSNITIGGTRAPGVKLSWRCRAIIFR